MGGKRAAHTCGIMELEIPLSCKKSKSNSKPNTKRNSSNQRGVEKTTTTVYKDEFPGGSSVEFSKRHKVKEFVDNNTGRLSCKEEVMYKSTFKVDDGVQGLLNVVQTQVEFKKAPKPTKNTTKCTNKHIIYDF